MKHHQTIFLVHSSEDNEIDGNTEAFLTLEDAENYVQSMQSGYTISMVTLNQ